VFKGTYRHKLDPKGRLPVPAPFRRALAQSGARSVVLTVLDQCLAAYSPREWARLEERLSGLSPLSKPARALTRLLASRAVECPLDGQGRVLIPSPLRQAAGLTREAAVIGVLNRFEVWVPESWQAFLRESERLLEDAALEVQWPPASDSPPASVTADPARHPQPKPNG
jgi:MraZ protein